MDVMNLFSLRTDADPSDPPGYRAGAARLGPHLGASLLGGTVYDIPPTQSIYPYHYEHGNEEWLIVLKGRPTLRAAGTESEGGRTLEPGDVVCFPPGPRGGHKVTNRSDAPARVLVISTQLRPAITVLPDSDKIAVRTGDPRDDLVIRRDSGVGYYDGERP